MKTEELKIKILESYCKKLGSVVLYLNDEFQIFLKNDYYNCMSIQSKIVALNHLDDNKIKDLKIDVSFNEYECRYYLKFVSENHNFKFDMNLI